jgi:ubiquinol-cytochrome c reductase iron-sulfur subunit
MGRANDREMGSEVQIEWRERWGTPLVVFFFFVAILGGVGFLIFYWSGRNGTALLGGSLALFLGGMGITLVVWARLLMSDKQAVEPRHVLQSSISQREATAQALCGGAQDICRRKLLTWMGLTGVGLFGTMELSLMRSLGLSPDASLYSRIWQGRQRLVTQDGKPVSLTMLQPGSTVTVFPEDKIGNELAQTVLIRVKEHLLQLPEDRAGCPR